MSTGRTFNNSVTANNANGLLAWASDAENVGTATLTPTAATIHLHKVPMPFGGTIANVLFQVTTVFAGNSNCQVGVYNSAGTLLGSSADISSTLQSTGVKTVGVSAESGQSLAIPSASFVFVALHAGALASGVVRATSNSLLTNIGTTAATSRAGTYTGHITNTLTTIGALTPASITQVNQAPWFGVS